MCVCVCLCVCVMCGSCEHVCTCVCEHTCAYVCVCMHNVVCVCTVKNTMSLTAALTGLSIVGPHELSKPLIPSAPGVPMT